MKRILLLGWAVLVWNFQAFCMPPVEQLKALGGASIVGFALVMLVLLASGVIAGMTALFANDELLGD